MELRSATPRAGRVSAPRRPSLVSRKSGRVFERRSGRDPGRIHLPPASWAPMPDLPLRLVSALSDRYHKARLAEAVVGSRRIVGEATREAGFGRPLARRAVGP